MQKVCPVIFRTVGGRREVLAFLHPIAGRQFVKGTIEPDEAPDRAAVRELQEESGLSLPSMAFAGTYMVGADRQAWHFFYAEMSALPDDWRHLTLDDHGYVFAFFWHAVDAPLGDDWHPLFHEVFHIIRDFSQSR